MVRSMVLGAMVVLLIANYFFTRSIKVTRVDDPAVTFDERFYFDVPHEKPVRVSGGRGFA